MPDVRMPDGTIIKNVPDNMTPEQKAKFAEFGKAYMVVPGLAETGSAVAKEEAAKKKEWLGARDNLSKTRDLRYKALRSIDAPEKLAEAYGFKPEDFKPGDLQSRFETFQSTLGSGDWWNRKAPHIGALGANLANATMAPVMFGKQVYTRSTGNQYDVNNNTLGNMVEQELLHAQTGDKPVSSFIGAALGSTPVALATGGNGNLWMSGLSGATTAALTPNTTQNSMGEETFKKVLIGAPLGIAGGAVAHSLSAAPKAVAGATKTLPPIAAENQALIGRALKIKPGNISASDLASNSDGVKTLQTAITSWRNNAKVSGKYIPRKDEQNLVQMNRAVSGIADDAKSGYEATPFGDGTNPQGLSPRQAIQESLPMEQARRQSDIVTPLYDAITPRPANAPSNTSTLLQTVDDLIGKMRGTGAGSKYTSPMTTGREGQSGPSALNVLETQRGNLVGNPSAGAQPWDNVYGLMQLRENLSHNLSQYGFGNTQTRPISETLKVVDDLLSKVHATPEWQAHLASSEAASSGAAQWTKPYQQDIVQNLLQKKQGGQVVTPDQAFSTVKGYQPDQISMIRGLLEQKGQAGLNTAAVDDLARDASTETMPVGMQVQRGPLMEGIADPRTQAMLSPEYLAKMNEVNRALQLMDQIGASQPSVAPASTLAVGAGSQRGMLRAGWELLGQASAPLLFNERIKAMLLTPSFHNSNLVPGMVRSGAQNVVSGAGGATAGAQRDTWGIDNPMPRP